VGVRVYRPRHAPQQLEQLLVGAAEAFQRRAAYEEVFFVTRHVWDWYEESVDVGGCAHDAARCHVKEAGDKAVGVGVGPPERTFREGVAEQ